MRKILLSLLLVGAVASIGCDMERRSRSHDGEELVCNGCQDLPESKPYLINIAFVDHDGKQITFTEKIYRAGGKPTSHVYEICGVRYDGREEYYYSERLPQRDDNGLYHLYTINGPSVWIDFTSIKASLIPCNPLPLDAVSAERKRYMREYGDRKRDCPIHDQPSEWMHRNPLMPGEQPLC